MTALVKYSIVLAVLFLGASVQAQKLNGSYSGNLEVQGTQLELIFNITPT